MDRNQNSAVTLLVLCSLLLGLSALIAQGAQGQESNFNLEGKITAVSPGKLTVQMESNIIMHVAYSAQTGIYRKDGSAGSPKDFKAGVVIKVQGQLNSSGILEARRIDLE